MDNRQFGNSYRELPEKKLPSNPDRREILDAPRKWMRFFNDTMNDYLVGNEPPDRVEFVRTLTEYFVWSQSQLTTLIRQAREIDNPLEPNDIATEFMFHQINGPLTSLWCSLLYEDTNTSSTFDINDMQGHLSASMAESSRRLNALDQKPETQNSKEYIILKGTLSEVDTVITLLEMMKENPCLIVLPAPEMYESSRESINRNVDILVFDVLNKQVHGVQVKTDTVDGSGRYRKYDKEYVTVVDSAHELGNTRYDPRSQNFKRSLPGQIAMDILSQRPIHNTPTSLSKPDFMRSRQIAKELSRGKKSFLPQAVRHLTDRILPELEIKIPYSAIDNEESA